MFPFLGKLLCDGEISLFRGENFFRKSRKTRGEIFASNKYSRKFSLSWETAYDTAEIIVQIIFIDASLGSIS
jgi:hypothetical protein